MFNFVEFCNLFHRVHKYSLDAYYDFTNSECLESWNLDPIAMSAILALKNAFERLITHPNDSSVVNKAIEVFSLPYFSEKKYDSLPHITREKIKKNGYIVIPSNFIPSESFLKDMTTYYDLLGRFHKKFNRFSYLSMLFTHQAKRLFFTEVPENVVIDALSSAEFILKDTENDIANEFNEQDFFDMMKDFVGNRDDIMEVDEDSLHSYLADYFSKYLTLKTLNFFKTEYKRVQLQLEMSEKMSHQIRYAMWQEEATINLPSNCPLPKLR